MTKPDVHHPSSDYRADIDGLRAVAILSVVAFHAFPDVVTGGFVGVDIFFVISGYLISSLIINNLESGKFSFFDFYARRIRRLFPALALVLIACYALGWLLLLPGEYAQLGKHIAGGSVFISNFILWSEHDYFDQLTELKPLLHLWSLGVEEQFYLTWPLLVYLMWKRRINFFYAIIAIGGISFALNVCLIKDYPTLTFYWPVTRFWELMMGGGLAYNSIRGQNLPNHKDGRFYNTRAMLGLLLIILSVFGIDKEHSYPGWLALLPVTGTFLLISTGPDTWIHRKLLCHPNTIWIGLISYPLYLWHWPLLAYLRMFYTSLDLTPIRFRLAVIVVSIVLAGLTYQFLERPVRFGKHSRTKTVALIVALLCMGLIGLITDYYDGVPSRMPESIREFASTNYDPVKDWRSHQCFLDPVKEKFDNVSDCVEPGKKPLLLLWGDSHAAALYPGLKSLEDEYNFRLAQFTTSACPPLLTWDDPEYQFCKFNNDAVFAFIKKTPPDIVLLQARWDVQKSDVAPVKLEYTIAELKKAGVRRIIVIGPVPRWPFKLPSIARISWLSHTTPPARLPVGFRFIVKQDTIMRAVSRKSKVEYISPYDALCNRDGCITHSNGENSPALLFDNDHLSPQGSSFLMHLLARDLFPGQSPLKK